MHYAFRIALVVTTFAAAVNLRGLPVQAAQSAARQSVAISGASARSAILSLGKRFRANISIPGDLHGSVTLALHNVTLEQALTAALAPLGYTFARKNGIIVISRVAGTIEQVAGRAAPAVPTVLPVSFITPERSAATIRNLFPDAIVRADHAANAVIVTASPSDLQSIRGVLQSLDVRGPKALVVEAMTVRNVAADRITADLRPIFPTARFTAASKTSLLVRATPLDMAQIRTLVPTLDVLPSLGSQPGLPSSTEAVKVSQAPAIDVARAVARQFSRVRTSVSGSAIVLSGPPEDVTKAKALIAQIDVPPVGSRLTQIYRIRTLDATSVGDLIARSFSDAQVNVDKEINALSVTAATATLQRIAEAVAQLDGAPNQPGYPTPGINQGLTPGSSFEVVSLRSVIPSQGQVGYGTDLAASPVLQALQQLAPGVRVSALGTPGQIVLIGDPLSLRLAKEFLAKADVTPALVVLDTEILEIDESTARNLGLLLSQPVISTSFTELSPIFDPSTGQSRLINLSAITRSPLSLAAQLNLQIQRGNARVLADPRITTLSGRTATFRAGDTIGILTTVGGGPGTYTTTQLQSFQTGVSLDITPIVTAGNEVTVALHPVVNSLSGIVNGVPQIATRDTQTTVHLKNNQTLIIGGLIQEAETRTQNKIPILGDLPLLGGIFRNNQSSRTRNELIIVVTPHVLVDGEPIPTQGPALPTIPTPQPLPTLPPGSHLPEPSGRISAQIGSVAPSTAPTPPAHLGSPAPSAAVTPKATGYAAGDAASLLMGNSVTYGQVPASNVAGATDPVSIFYARVMPAALSNNAKMQVRLITTTNATRASLTLGSLVVQLTQSGPGQWFASFPFQSTYVVGQTTTQLGLSATRPDGASATINLQMTVIPQQDPSPR
jgi:type II secretory pathway component GspD/PulD (secretin)